MTRLDGTVLIYPHQHHPHPLANGKRLQPRLLFPGHARFGLPNIENYLGPLNALDRGVDDLAHAPDVFVVNRVALRLAHLLKNDLLGNLRGDAPQSFC